MRKIGAIIPVFAAKDFIRAFLRQCSYIDKIVFLTHDNVWEDYVLEHGSPSAQDETPDIIRESMKTDPRIEFHHVKIPNDKWKRAPFHWNAGLPFVQDCDIVLRLDIDYFMSQEDWKKAIDYIRTTRFDAYTIDFSPKTTTNYYVTGSFDYGLDDSDGVIVLAFNTRYPLEHEQNTTGETRRLDEAVPGIKLHHLRGWKPRYNKEWADSLEKKWTSAPQEIKDYFK